MIKTELPTCEATIQVDSIVKKIIGDKDYIVIPGKNISSFDIQSKQLLKHKNKFFDVSYVNNVVTKKITIKMSGIVCWLNKEEDYYNTPPNALPKYTYIANAYCLKKIDQKNIDYFRYENLNGYFVLYFQENLLEFAKLKLIGL